MSRRFRLSLVILQNERLGQEVLEDGQYLTIELEQVRLPVTIRANAVHPTAILIDNLLIVWEEVGILIHNGAVGAKHQQSSVGQSIFASLPIFSKHIEFFQELVFRQ